MGVNGGYLGDFSYRTHFEFYPQFCDLDIDPSALSGTTRERFIDILSKAGPAAQARIIRGILAKYPSGSVKLRTAEKSARLEAMASRLEAGGAVPLATPAFTSEVLLRAIADAETLLTTSGAQSGVDRMHTAFHGFLKLACARRGITYGADPSITELYKALRREHPALREIGVHGDEVERVIKSFASAIDSLNTLRNRGSVAHPNDALLGPAEALLYINAVRSLMTYLGAKLSSTGAG
ncbi:MAG: abortive infection family protein [Polyangiaceae bacterium]|nr:abortive infection family protein [Polyangiaceae bacterium]